MLGHVIAERFSTLRVANLELNRWQRMVDRGIERRIPREIREAARLADEALDALMFGVTAHELQWAHMPDECPICKGEVQL